jgi:hypothetical protein
VRAPAGLHANQAGWEISQEGQDLLAAELLLQHGKPGLVDTEQMKDVFAQVDSYARNIRDSAHFSPLSPVVVSSRLTDKAVSGKRDGSIPLLG